MCMFAEQQSVIYRHQLSHQLAISLKLFETFQIESLNQDYLKRPTMHFDGFNMRTLYFYVGSYSSYNYTMYLATVIFFQNQPAYTVIFPGNCFILHN
ncbi:hypothetical protein A0J61_09936 [Choanephora cucurbitarum]|uniref:Uncharacterized protein n=1 Tax=Choanephora cucurbitarum TaxID=101091 RepID=A0A1C7MYW0_9FUNG|nr:hypothetical protein A0J61_09936 [Choanephora cucurbitarum]